MRKIYSNAGKLLGALVVLGTVLGIVFFEYTNGDLMSYTYSSNCAGCHGRNLGGSETGPALVGRVLDRGESVAELANSIAFGFSVPGGSGATHQFADEKLKNLAIYIAEQRQGRNLVDFKTITNLDIPDSSIETMLNSFSIETIATGISAKAFSIAPLPDNRMLVTEKIEGLSVISIADGSRIKIVGTPETGGVLLNFFGLDVGSGYLLDVALHPDYSQNGWVYLAHTHLCLSCSINLFGKLPATMTRVVRGRIVGNEWRDEEEIWKAPQMFYTTSPDIGVGGRLTFDSSGYVYFSIGIKGLESYEGELDLATPYRKIHRVHDDGRIPLDNPFVQNSDAMPSIWTYGHRSPQGLEFDATTGKLWESEMGPRGGDEINLLEAGRNYGWPEKSNGINYRGTSRQIDYSSGASTSEYEYEEPIVDFTPAPAVSSFVIYRGEAFPEWNGDLIVGSLKATELYRITIEDDKHAATEVLITDLARIRDIEVDGGGNLYLLLEHANGSQIVRLSAM